MRHLLLSKALLAALLLATPVVGRAVDLKPLRPQEVLKCSPGAARRAPPGSGALLAPLVKGAFTPIPLESVEFVDKAAAKIIMVQSLMAQRTPTNTVEVEARLVNCSKDAQQIEVRTSFLSEGMAAVEPTSAWTRVFLQPFSTGVYSEKSVATTVGHYLLEVRKAQ